MRGERPADDLLVALALAGLALAPTVPAAAAIPLCTASGRPMPAPDVPGPAKACHALCEMRRRDG